MQFRHGGTRLQHMRHSAVSQRLGEFHTAQIRSIETGEFRSGRNQRADRLQQHMVGSERFVHLYFTKLRLATGNEID